MKFICTFTGLDSHSDLTRLVSLSQKYPFIEWGVLFSFTRMGKEPRYPSYELMAFIADSARFYNMQVALHLCGRAARSFLTDEPSDMVYLNPLLRKYNRIQVNVDASKLDFAVAPKLIYRAEELNKPIIFQYNNNNAYDVGQCYPSENKNIHILKDASGGEGIYSADVTIPECCKKASIGFAGGYGPHNIKEVFPAVVESVFSNNVEGDYENPQFAIDMEGKIRTPYDYLDLDKVETVAEFVNDYLFTQGRLAVYR